MKRFVTYIGMILTGTIALTGVGKADVLVLAPTRIAVLPSDESGMTRVAMLFDLSAMRTGENRRVDEALLEWHVRGVPEERSSEYSVHAISESWTVQSVESGVPNHNEAAASRWTIDPLDSERIHGRFVRLNIAELVTGWSSGETANVGVLLTSPDVTRANALLDAESIRLTVRYGFRKY